MYIYSVNYPDNKFEIVDEKARESINNINATLNSPTQINDWNQALTSGSYYSSVTAANLPTSVTTLTPAPILIYGEAKCISINSKNIIHQSLFINVDNNYICAYVRCKHEDTWTDWTNSTLDNTVITKAEFTNLLNKA